jgi:hypothetical protein
MGGNVFLLKAMEEVFKCANIESSEKVSMQLQFVSHHTNASIGKCARKL